MAAAACYKHIGKGDKLIADKTATDSIRKNLNSFINCSTPCFHILDNIGVEMSSSELRNS